ncbi:MAG: tRNA pseudouridine(38-40) synthase TruA [Clostridiales bacterium]|jgi:tRNA pseudouridine38-40 synthase|nr:tRNA pseudouridine(38-40) synthase TruA [Clostridiales bacterium]
MEKRYLIITEYDGANYCGWQRQKNGVSVQSVIEEKLSIIFGCRVTLHGSSRTDAGVSAYEQTAHFDVDTNIPPEKIPHAVNSLLPKDISIVGCKVVDDDFHARFSDKKKTYAYRLYISNVRRPLFDRERLWIKRILNIDAMREAAAYVEGTYDCKCFQKSGSPRVGTIRTVMSVKVICTEKDIVDIEITAKGFLYKMARTIAGTLVYVGLNKLSPTDVLHAVQLCDKTKTGKTLPGEYLYLLKTEYV